MRLVALVGWLVVLACAPSAVDWRTYHAAAAAAAERGDYESAETHLASAEREAVRLGPGEAATTSVAQGRLRREVGDHDGAELRYTQAETLLESPDAQQGRASGVPAPLALEHGRLALALNDPETAEMHFRRALREARRSEGPDSPTEGWAQLGLGRSLRLQGKSPAARTALLRALAIHRGESAALRPAHTPGVMAALTELAALDRTEGRLEQARSGAIDALRISRRELGVSHPRIAPVLTELAVIELARGDVTAAAAAARRADEIASSRLPAGHATRVEASRVRETVELAEAALTPP